MLRTLLNDESGFLISAELVLIFTLVFCAVAVGVSVVKDSLSAELHDVSEAIGALNQTYITTGLQAAAQTGNHATCAGSGYTDERDDCDCSPLTLTVTMPKADPSTIGDAEGT